jgi:hypothetical protein
VPWQTSRSGEDRAALALGVHADRDMGMLVALGFIAAFVVIVALFVHAVRAERSFNAHRWIVVLPLLIFIGWIIEQIIMG